MVDFLLDGAPSKNPRLFNRALSKTLPSSNSHFGRCLSAFCRVLFNIKKLTDTEWQIGPNPTQVTHVEQLPLSIANKPIISTISLLPSQSSLLHGISNRVRHIFIDDLRQAGIPCYLFNWGPPWESHWNTPMCAFIVKHWNYAYKSGAFANFPISSSHNK